jgi:hypothetical protein
MKKVLIIAPEYMGYIVKVAEELRKHHNIEVIDIHVPVYKYPNIVTKFKNIFLKRFSKDVKFNFRENHINKIIGNQNFDSILIIRPDLLSINFLKELKTKSTIFKTYFFDGVHRFPKKIKTIPLFDEIFSFEPNDCKKYSFEFITNFIYEENPTSIINPSTHYNVFNITSYDRKRFPLLLKIAALLKQQQQPFKIIVKTEKKIETKGLIEIISQSIPLDQVQSFIQQSICMLDLGVIHKHKGLTFRIFEAIGLNKKIITNNTDIVNYDFYNPQNILVISDENPIIPNNFLETAYNPIPQSIYKKYTLESWVKTVFRELL